MGHLCWGTWGNVSSLLSLSASLARVRIHKIEVAHIKWFVKSPRERSRAFGKAYFLFREHAISVKVRTRVVYEGRVQGVFFRANAKKCADSLGVNGWVRNAQDGSVEAEFEGEERAVKQAIELCAEMQPYARVTSKRVTMLEGMKDYNAFLVLP